MKRFVTYQYRGTDYRMIFNLYAMEQIEDEFGSMKTALGELEGGKQFKALRKMFRFLGNGALVEQDQEPTLTGDEILKADLKEMARLSDAVKACFALGRKTETEAGEAGSDEKRELFEDEEDEKNG